MSVDADTFANQLVLMARNGNQKERKLLQIQGTKLAREMRKKANREVRKTTVVREGYTRMAGTYHKRIKKGKVYWKNGAQRVRIYNGDSIGHLIEDGWTPRARDGTRGQPQRGKKIFARTAQEFERDFLEACDDLLNELVRGL